MKFLTSTPGQDPIVIEAYYAVSTMQVFQAWTDPDIVKQWFGKEPNSLHSASIDLKPGGHWRFLKSNDSEKAIGFEGQYLTIEPGKRLVFTWSAIVEYHDGRREASPDSQIDISFTQKGTGSYLRLVHSSIHDETTCKGFAGGWQYAFTSLHRLLNNRKGDTQ